MEEMTRRDLLRLGPYLLFSGSLGTAQRARRLDNYYAGPGITLEQKIKRQEERIVNLWKKGKVPLPAMIKTIEPLEGYIMDRCEFFSKCDATKNPEEPLPKDLVLGMAVLENGGGTDMRSECCRGVMQLSAEVARACGLKVGYYIQDSRTKRQKRAYMDERRDPRKNIHAAVCHLSYLYNEYFGEWLLSSQAYHSGSGAVRRALSICTKNRIQWEKISPEIVKERDLTWEKMMQNRIALNYLLTVPDGTETYVPRAYACHRIYADRGTILKR